MHHLRSGEDLHNAPSVFGRPEVGQRRVEAVRKRLLCCVWELDLQPARLNDEPRLDCPAEEKTAKRTERPPPASHLLSTTHDLHAQSSAKFCSAAQRAVNPTRCLHLASHLMQTVPLSAFDTCPGTRSG